MFSWFDTSELGKMNYTFLALIILLVSYSTVIAEKFYSTQFFAPFSLVAEKMAEYNLKYGTDKTISTVNVIHPNYIHYYSDRFPSSPQFNQYICNRASQFVELKQMLDTSKAQTMIHGWSNNYHAPEVEMIIKEKFPFLVQYDPFFNAGVMVYSKDSTWPLANAPRTLTTISNDFESVIWPDDEKFRTDSIAANGKWSMKMTPEQEYSSTYRSSAANLGLTQGAVYQISCKYLADTVLADVVCVLSITRKAENVIWRGVQLHDFPAKNNNWATFYAGYKFVEYIMPDDEVSIYFMNASRQKFFIDDVVFRVLEK
ncbi:MAG: hypothetical protein IPK10_09550 [Bacteroidetes bacterium]|nr:hypothetical protein [Bacteroidota bacterium]